MDPYRETDQSAAPLSGRPGRPLFLPALGKQSEVGLYWNHSRPVRSAAGGRPKSPVRSALLWKLAVVTVRLSDAEFLAAGYTIGRKNATSRLRGALVWIPDACTAGAKYVTRNEFMNVNETDSAIFAPLTFARSSNSAG